MTQRERDKLFERCCEDLYKATPKRDYFIKDNVKIWPEDEEMKKQLQFYDQAHSKAKCISEEYLKKLEDEMNAYIADRVEPMCVDDETNIINCIDNKGNLTQCDREIEEFKQCIDKNVHRLYQKKYLYG